MSSLSAPEAAKEVREILGIPDHLLIAYACRVGYPAGSRGKYLRVRRDVEGFAHRNRYGSAWR